MTLAEPVDDVVPYPVELEKILALRRGDKVITVAHSMDFIASGQYPKHYGKCAILDIYGPYSAPTGYSTACGGAEYSSGGSLLSVGPMPTLLGIWVQNFESVSVLERAEKLGKPNIVHWQKDSAGSYYVPIAGEFWKALADAADVDVRTGIQADARIDDRKAINALKTIGLQLTTKSEVERCSLESNPFHGCVVVESLAPNSPATNSGLVVGDTIAWIGDQNSVTLDQVLKEVSILLLNGATSMDVIAMRADGSKHTVRLPLK
jgi:membrane-associated protease RseP (regulator of RpoE activity)